MTDEHLLLAAFERAMQPARARQWDTFFDYRPAATSYLYASHPVCAAQTYTKVVFTHQDQVAAFERWFTSCAALLLRLVDGLPAR